MEAIGKSDWKGGQYLQSLLRESRLKERSGASTRLLLLTEGDELISFCTYAERDDIPAPSLSPWIGFVYTFPKYRGYRYAGLLLAYAEDLAWSEGKTALYVSSREYGLYEKYGFSFYKTMKDENGQDSRVFRLERMHKGA